MSRFHGGDRSPKSFYPNLPPADDLFYEGGWGIDEDGPVLMVPGGDRAGFPNIVDPFLAQEAIDQLVSDSFDAVIEFLNKP